MFNTFSREFSATYHTFQGSLSNSVVLKTKNCLDFHADIINFDILSLYQNIDYKTLTRQAFKTLCIIITATF